MNVHTVPPTKPLGLEVAAAPVGQVEPHHQQVNNYLEVLENDDEDEPNELRCATCFDAPSSIMAW
jgi:hypothetical protein